MVIRWNYVATLVVVTLTVIHGQKIDPSVIEAKTSNSKFEDLCPCLPVDICPRVFGTKPDDTKYLGDIKKCDDDNEVRCCGASTSFVVGKSNVTTETPNDRITTPGPQSDISSRLNADDVQENEISDAESESVKMLSGRSESSEILSTEETKNIADIQPIEGGQSEPKSNTSEIAPRSYRKPKNLDNVMMVYPNIMSGVPKTTPKNMPETNEMTMFDQEAGMDVHLVFSKTTAKPEPTVQIPLSSTVDSATKPPHYRFAKRRRQNRPIQKLTTEAPTENIELKHTTLRSRTLKRQRTTTEFPVEDIELMPTTLRSRTLTRQRTKTREFTSTTATQDLTDSTTKQPRVKLTTITPSTQEGELLVTSEDDKSQRNRFRLFNARHRLNFLRRSTTTATTESSIEVTTTQSNQSKSLNKNRPSRVNVNVPETPISARPAKMNETLIRAMDTNHRNMISKVRFALNAATTENKITEIPRSFASVDMNNRVKKIESMLVEKMIDVYTETKAKRRGGDQLKRKEATSVQNVQPISTTERPVAKQTSNSTRPFRGNKKFQVLDLLDKTPIVRMSPNEFRRAMRVRSTTERPVTDSIVTTTRRPRRRPTTPIQETTSNEKKSKIRDASLPENYNEGNVRRRVSMRRRYNVDVEPSSTPTPPPQSSSESIPIGLSSTTIPTTVPTISLISTETTTASETTTATPATESTAVLNESKNDFPEEFEGNLTKESLSETQDQTIEKSKSIETVDIEETVTEPNLPPTENSDLLSDFKPSPLWSISSDEKTDFIVKEENHSYDMNMNERNLRKGHRRSRNAFDPPAQYLNGFVPVSSLIGPDQFIGPIPKSSKLGGDAKVRYNLPRESKVDFSKN